MKRTSILSPLLIILIGRKAVKSLVGPTSLERRAGSTGIFHTTQHNKVLLYSTRRQPNGQDDSALISDALEKRVYASAQSNVDFQRVLDALDSLDRTEFPSRTENDDLLLYEDERNELRPPIVEPWKIGLAAASAAAVASFIVFHNFSLSVFLMGFLFTAATLDDESLSGALARILGRTTIRSVQATEPKLKALARAVVTGENEVQELKRRNEALEAEVHELRLWKDRRLKIEAAMPYYSVEELKRCARANGLAVGGTKNELMMRLVIQGALSLENF